MDEFEQAYGPSDEEPPDDAELIDITPLPFLPYADTWIKWLEHARKCGPCTRATIKHVQQLDVYANEVCATGVPLGQAVRDAITEQHTRALLN
jgi:hypothetical protein